MNKINILYFSATGNTLSFVKKIKENSDLIGEAKSIGQETEFEDEEKPFIAIVPTYLSGPDGIGPNVLEEMSYPLHDYIEFNHNKDLLIGVVASGNLNFNQQYALTGKRYSEEFNVPLILKYELSGSKFDAQKVINFIEEYNK